MDKGSVVWYGGTFSVLCLLKLQSVLHSPEKHQARRFSNKRSQIPGSNWLQGPCPQKRSTNLFEFWIKWVLNKPLLGISSHPWALGSCDLILVPRITASHIWGTPCTPEGIPIMLKKQIRIMVMLTTSLEGGIDFCCGTSFRGIS